MNPLLLDREQRQQPAPPSGRPRGEKTVLVFLALAAAASIAKFIVHLVSPEFFVRAAEQCAPDGTLAPATRVFLKQFVETSTLLVAVLSLYALIARGFADVMRKRALAVFIGVAAVLHWLYYYPFTIDDAYISLVYARNFASGNGLVFNLGERVEGYTNPLWVMVEASLFIGLFCGLVVLVLTYRMAMLCGARTESALFAPLLLAISAPFATASALGLETQLFTLLIVAAAYRYLKSDTSEPGLVVPLLLALATLTRPEGALFFVALYAHAFMNQLAARRVSGRLSTGMLFPTIVAAYAFMAKLATKRFSGRLFTGALLFAAIVAAHACWRYSYYGAWVPNTYFAKLEGSNWRTTWGLLHLRDFFRAYGGSLFIVCIIPFMRRERFRKTSLLLMFVVPYLAYVAYAGGDWIPRFRFIEPVTPFVFILFAAGLGELYSAVEQRARESLLAQAVVLLFLGFLFSFFIRDTVSAHKFAMVRAGGARESHVGLGNWLREHTAPGEAVALMDIGMVKYYSGREVIDISGLTDAHVARLPGGFLKKRFDIEYLFERNPKYVVLVSHNDIRKGGGFVSTYPIDKSIYDNPLFHERYRFVYNIDHLFLREQPRANDGYWMNVFERTGENNG
jgi:hypothetical protein